MPEDKTHKRIKDNSAYVRAIRKYGIADKKCELCGQPAKFRYRRDGNKFNMEPENIQFLCASCFAGMRALKISISDERAEAEGMYCALRVARQSFVEMVVKHFGISKTALSSHVATSQSCGKLQEWERAGQELAKLFWDELGNKSH